MVFGFGFVSGKCKDQGTDKDKEDNEDNTRDYAANAPSWFTLNLGHDQTIMLFSVDEFLYILQSLKTTYIIYFVDEFLYICPKNENHIYIYIYVH